MRKLVTVTLSENDYRESETKANKRWEGGKGARIT